jgi:hypothetical protein
MKADGDDDVRSWVKLDRFAMFEASRRHDLSASEYVVLDALVRLASWRTAEWRGTRSELSADLPTGRRTIAAAVSRLHDLGLIRVVRQFGKNREGIVLVLAYRDLVVLTSKADQALATKLAIVQNGAYEEEEHAPNSAYEGGAIRAQYAPNTRPIRARYAPGGANDPSLTSEDADSRGFEEERGEEEIGLAARSTGEEPIEAPLDVEPCFHCHDPSTVVADGIAMCDACRPYSAFPKRDAEQLLGRHLGAMVVGEYPTAEKDQHEVDLDFTGPSPRNSCTRPTKGEAT